MRITKRQKIKYLRRAAAIALVVLVISSAFVGISYWEKHSSFLPSEGQEVKTVTYRDKVYELKDNMQSVLLIGLDTYEDEISDDALRNDQQADFLILLAIDNDEKICTPIQISRDTMTSINVLGIAGNTIDTKVSQIALAHTYGNGKNVSCRNTADAVSEMFENIKINDYVSLTMSAVPTLNDLAGGVTVQINDDFSGVDSTLVMGETVTLKGEHALNYIRGRYTVGDQTNTNRMARQREYLTQLYDQIMTKVNKDDDFISTAVAKVSENMISNMDVNKLQTLSEKLSEYTVKPIVTIDGDYIKGEEYMEFYPDTDAVTKTVVEVFCKES